MNGVLWYSLLSVIIVSLISFVGVFTIGIKIDSLRKFLIYVISFAAGAMLGGAFIHLIPELAEDGLKIVQSFYILGGIALFFVVEKIIHWRHCHMPEEKGHVPPFAYSNFI